MKASAGTSRTPLPGMTPLCPAKAFRATTKTLRKELHGGYTALSRGLRFIQRKSSVYGIDLGITLLHQAYKLVAEHSTEVLMDTHCR